MQPFVQKNIFSVVVVAAMFVVALIASLTIVAVQRERDSLNADVRRTNSRIRVLETKEIPEARVHRDAICNATTVREKAQRRGFHDAERTHVIHVRSLKVPYGKSLADPNPRAEAIELASNNFGISATSVRQ